MTVWVGYAQAAVPYARDARYAGETKFTLRKMVSFSLDAISSFSNRPLQLASLLGFVISTLAFIAIPVVIVLRLMGSYLPGFGSITISILLLGGIQLISIGIIGEYVGRIYDEVKGRPLYLVRGRGSSLRTTTLRRVSAVLRAGTPGEHDPAGSEPARCPSRRARDRLQPPAGLGPTLRLRPRPPSAARWARPDAAVNSAVAPALFPAWSSVLSFTGLGLLAALQSGCPPSLTPVRASRSDLRAV